MSQFSETYAKARDVIAQQKFAEEWQKFLRDEVKVTALMTPTHLDVTHADGLDKLRKKIKDSSRGALAAFFVGGGAGDTIVAACKANQKDATIAERAATLKMLKHLYLAQKRGGQDVWVYAPPKAYTQWIFDEIKGTEDKAKKRLKEEAEVYSENERKIMSGALLLALNWSQNAIRKLGDKDTDEIIRRWFADEDTTEQRMARAVDTLRDGFKKIAAVCNSTRLVFSDEPIDRNKGGWKDWAFVYRQEKMDVVYLQGAFLKSGNSGRLWMCALTIIHELSHRAVGTDDHRYDNDGLKPSKTSFPFDKALDNADSWAYFATDLAGMLSKSDRLRVLS